MNKHELTRPERLRLQRLLTDILAKHIGRTFDAQFAGHLVGVLDRCVARIIADRSGPGIRKRSRRPKRIATLIARLRRGPTFYEAMTVNPEGIKARMEVIRKHSRSMIVVGCGEETFDAKQSTIFWNALYSDEPIPVSLAYMALHSDDQRGGRISSLAGAPVTDERED